PARANVPPMKNLPRFLALGATLGMVAFASAQTADDTSRPARRGPGGPGGPGGPRGGNAIVRALDTDGDRTISSAEIAAASVALKALDANNDGVVSASEQRPPRPADAPQPPA